MKKVILISGMSGAGKTSTMSILEDMGYHCIDQFPVQLLSNLVDLIENSTDPRYENTVLATNSQDFPDFLRIFKGNDINVQILFLDASNDVLLHRYKSTRRTHPLLLSNKANTLEEAISEERSSFARYKDMNLMTIDTTFLKNKELKKKLEQYFSVGTVSSFTVSFISFGYKHGVPMDADIILDVRCLPNPYWDVELRPYSGDDACVYDYVMDNEQTQQFVKKMDAFLDFALEEYAKEGRNHFTIAIGCTGGQHRSVSIANYLYDRYKGSYKCFKEHRDKVGLNDE